MHLIDVVLLTPPFKKYTYKIPSPLKNCNLEPGIRVIVPVQKRYTMGIIIKSHQKKHVDFKIKELILPIDKKPLFLKEQLEIFEDISTHLLVELGQVISSVTPSKLMSLKLYFLDKKGNKFNILELLKKGSHLLNAFLAKWINGDVKIVSQSKEDIIVELICSPPWPVKKNAKTQLDILEYLYTQGPQKKSHIIAKFGKYSGNVLRSFLNKGLIRFSSKNREYSSNLQYDYCSSYNLTKEQKEVIDVLIPYIEKNIFKTVLLHGVTGCGKTLIYEYLIKKSLELNKNSIILLPEVALAESLYQEIKQFFSGVNIYFYHGYLSNGERTKIFKTLSQATTPSIIIGTRSAIFLPVKNIGTIIIDEEHDSSYKQDERLRYHVREIAYLLAYKFKSLLVFGSATPDLKTYYAAINQKIELLKMKKRVTGNPLPEIDIVNLNKNPPTHGPFSEIVFSEIKSTLDNGDQVIILLNRRGFSPVVFCTSCREVVKCPNCSVSMTYHKKIERLLCHYCGKVMPFPCNCPVCGAVSYIPLDVGTEQVEEFVKEKFGNSYKILRLDADSYRREKKDEDILKSFSEGRYQILVGTQMCSKGHNFPGVTLVVVVDGDIGLNLPDYRATERTFQLLVQVAGRSGRGQKPGKVFIQTRNPSHYCWQYIKNSDYEGFIQHELKIRQKRRYPPFVKLGLLRFQIREDYQQHQRLIEEIRDYIHKIKRTSLTVLGPAPAPIFILNKNKRYQCLLKADTYAPIRAFAAKIFKKYSNYKKRIKINLDLDPYHML